MIINTCSLLWLVSVCFAGLSASVFKHPSPHSSWEFCWFCSWCQNDGAVSISLGTGTWNTSEIASYSNLSCIWMNYLIAICNSSKRNIIGLAIWRNNLSVSVSFVFFVLLYIISCWTNITTCTCTPRRVCFQLQCWV